MNGCWTGRVHSYLERSVPVCRVIVARVRGSAPRECGAEMYVTASISEETIGGGQLEFEAIGIARSVLRALPEQGFSRQFRVFALGPNLGQCCGGEVTLLFEGFSPSLAASFRGIPPTGAKGFIHDARGDLFCQMSERLIDRPDYNAVKQIFWMPAQKAPVQLYLYGAGHVGRALMPLLCGLGIQPYWVDTDSARFPSEVPSCVTIVPAADMTVIAAHAPAGAVHIVMSYSHRLDEELVYTLLKKNVFSHLGLIGSATKYRRFCSALKKRGLSQPQLDRLVCPIGQPDIRSKKPGHLSLSIAAQIAVWLEDADNIRQKERTEPE